jgi:hypothetical protein
MSERMGQLSAWKAFLIVALAGVAPVCCACISYHGISTAGQVIVLTATPTGLFTLSLLASLSSKTMQRAVAFSASLAGILFVIALLIFLACGGTRGPGTGVPGHAIVLLAAWILGAVLSVVVLPIAVAKSFMAGAKTPTPTPDSPAESN